MSALNGQMPHTYDHEPGDGWSYSVLISELPHHGFMGGGSPNDYVVVTVWRPHDRGIGRTYVMAKHGTLTDRYVAEKFCDGLDPRARNNGFCPVSYGERCGAPTPSPYRCGDRLKPTRPSS